MATDCDDGNYLSNYSRFFKEFVASVNPNDQLPINVSSYNISEDEVVGEIISITLRFLHERSCPVSLEPHIVQMVLREINSICDKQIDDCGNKRFSQLKLMQTVTGKVIEICTRYLENSRLALIPPPLPSPITVASGIKNKRRKMEDRFVVLQDLHTIFSIKDESMVNYYAVFDGHSGQDAAEYCATHLHQYLVESIYYPMDPERALKDAFLTTDAKLVEKKEKAQKLNGGTTAVCALLINRTLYVAWVGDSSAALITSDSYSELTNPHRPNREDEIERILRTGGFFMGTRVNGSLAITRALGDVAYKPFVTGEPEIIKVELNGSEEFLVLASDGYWDFVKPEVDTPEVIRNHLQNNQNNPSDVSLALIRKAQQKLSQDNISVITVFLKRNMDCFDVEYSKKEQERFIGLENQAEAELNGLQPLPANGNHENGGAIDDDDEDLDGDEDLGPETDVDAVDDVSHEFLAQPNHLNQPAIVKNNFDDAKPDHENETSPHIHEPNQNVLINEADNVGDSEDSEDEWNYYRVDPKEEKKEAGETNETNEENQESIEADEKGSNEHCILDFQKETKCGSSQDLPKLIDTEISLEEKQDKPEALKIPEGEGIESEEDMEFHLNPDAAEFVPVSPSLIGTRVNLQDFPISGSPLKQAPIMDDIAIPSQREFDEEVCKRPSEMDETNCSNGDQENHECLQNKNLLDESDFSSTKAEFGDESHIRFVTATDMRSDFSALDSSFTSCDRDDYDIAKDPMAMSFTPSDFEAALEKPVDLNAVHNLDESMDERDIFDNVSTPLQKDFEMFSSNFEKTEEPREKEIQIMETKLPQSPMEPDSSNGEMLLDLPQESVEPQQNLFQIDESEDIVSKMENVHIGGSSEISSTVHPELLNLDSEQSFYEKQSMESEFQNEETSSLKNLDVGEQKDLDFGVESESKSQDEEVTEPITDSVPNIPVDDTLQSEMMDEQQPTTASSMELAGGVDNRGFHDDFMFTDNVTSTKTEVEEFATKDFVPDSPEQDVGKSTIGFSEAVEENQKHTCLTEPLDDAQTKNFVEITGDIQKNIMSLSDSMQEFTGLEQQLQPQLGTNPFLEAETTVDVEKEVSAEIEVTPEASVTEDTTEKNKIESLATVAAAAVAVTATASSVAAKSKKSAPKTSLRTSTPVKAAPKSSQSSPTKTVSCTTKTTTLATKKPTTASRPKQLDTKPTASQAAAKPTAKAPVKTTVKTATTSGRPSTATGTTARTSTGTTLASRPLTSTTKTSIGSRTVNAAKKAPLATSKPAATLEKKSLSNGEMKTLNKSASTRPPTKLTTTTTRTTTLNKVASKPATTSIAKPKPPAGAQTKPSTISLNKATPTSPSVVAKTRLVAAKSPMTDKQIKETANKQISQARTSTSTLSKPRTSGATSTTTSKRLTAVSKTSNTSMPSKKLPPTSKTTTKSSATTKVTRVSNTKTTVLQNGITAKAEVTNTLITESKVEEDLPKKDLSPVLTPTDNQLNVIAD